MEPPSNRDPQSPAETSAAQCEEIKANGDRCGVSKGIAPNGYCNSHNPDKLCCGERKNGDKCKAPRMPDYEYCMPQHDPSLKYVDPALFRSGRLRGNTAMVREVFTTEGCEDAYLGGKLPEESYLDGGNYHLDHVVECQVVAAIFSKLSLSADCEEKTVAVLHDITNDPKNLRLTATWANMAKEVAVKEFLNYWRIRKASDVLPFADYLGKATWWSSSTSTMCRFDEAQVARLCGVMAIAMQSFLAEIESKSGEFPTKKIYREVEKVATGVYSTMKLNVPQSKQAPKPKESTDKPKKEPKTRVAEEKVRGEVKEKRRKHKTRVVAHDSFSDTSSYSDSSNGSESDESPGGRSEAVTTAKAKPTPKKNTGKPKESSTTRVTEDAKAKPRAKRHAGKARAEEDDSYSDTSSYSESGSDSDSDKSPGPRKTAFKLKHKGKADKPEKISKTRVEEVKIDKKVKQKRRVRKTRVDEDESYSDNSDNYSDSDSDSDTDGPPQPRRQTPSKVKNKESKDKPKKSSTTHVLEKTKAKVKPKRRVCKTRVDDDDSYSDNSDNDGDSDSDSDEPPRRPRSKTEKEASGEHDKGAKEATPKRSTRRSTKERKDATADENVAPSSPPMGNAVGRRGPTLEPADKPRIRAHSTTKAA